MKTYARIDGGKVVEIIEPMTDAEGKEIPVENRFHPEIVAALVDVTEIQGVAPGWLYVNGVLSAPVVAVPSLSDSQAAAIKAIDADVDRIYADAIGNRQSEYDLAESDANAYKAAGYTGTVPGSVQAWATAKKKSATWAADDILATSANWRAVQADIRANRLVRKEDVRNAADAAGIDAAMTTWAAYVQKTRAALGV